MSLKGAVPYLVRIRKLFRDDETHFVQLAEHFFRRFFENEFISQGSEARLTVVNALALLALPPIFYTLFQVDTYANIWWNFPWQYPTVSLIDHFRLVTFSMVITGFIAILEWDALFPDRRDYANLAPLPLHAVQIFAAKITALLLFLSLFIVDVGGIPTLLYPLVETTGIRGHHVSFLRLCGMIGAHGVAIFSASAFSFLLFVALQGLLVNLLSPRTFKKVSLYVQVLGMIALLLLLFSLPIISTLLPTWQQARSAQFFWLPPLWFMGLYQTLLGSDVPAFHSLGWISVMALGLVTLACAAGYILNYKRHMQRALEANEADPAGPSWLTGAAVRLMNRLVLRKPLERATFYFVTRTIARSTKHRLYFATYVGVGLALALFGILELLVHSAQDDFMVVISRPNEALLTIPLIMSFFVLSGMRIVFTVPAELRANWVFQMAEDENRVDCLSGVRKAMVAASVITLASLFPLYAVLWGCAPAFMHLVFSLVLSLILVELLLLNFRKIPFTCSFPSGKANVTVLGFFYWFAFTTYAYTMATFERWLLQGGVRWIVFLGLAFLALWALVRWRNIMLGRGFSIVYEDAANPEVQTLGLSA
jgi:hypothetical protein